MECWLKHNIDELCENCCALSLEMSPLIGTTITRTSDLKSCFTHGDEVSMWFNTKYNAMFK